MGAKKNIGLFMGILENEFSAAILEGAKQGAKEFDANLIVFPMDLIHAVYADAEINMYRYQYNVLASFMQAEGLDGIILEYGTIVSCLDSQQKRDFLESVKHENVVLLSDEAEGYPSITVDNDSGLVEVIEHLVCHHGYTKIGYLSGTPNNCDAEARLAIFKDTTTKLGVYQGEDWIEHGDFSIYIEDKVINLITRHPDLEAIVCANDSMALGAASAIRKLGKEPGKDVFITGFDDIALGFLHSPALTTVKADPMELSYRGMEILCSGKRFQGNMRVKTRMVCRETCGCGNYIPDSKWKKTLGVDGDWRAIAKKQIVEDTLRRSLEHELCNVTREMVFANKSEKEQYVSILKTLKRLSFAKCQMYLYDRFIIHTDDVPWVAPEIVQLVGSYTDCKDSNYLVYEKGEHPVESKKIFQSGILQDDLRHDLVMIPLFFGQRQIGLLLVETEAQRFLNAYDMAGQISNTLYIIAMNEEQKRMKRELEEANKAKSQFLANMSHEIRTPINAIVGFNEMILRENQDSNIEDYAKDVKSAADALLMLVNDVLDFSKIEAGKMELVPVDYSLSELLDGIVSMMTSRAEKKGLALFLEAPDDLPRLLLGDSGRLQQILLNLLSNAIKYTEKGTVTLIVKWQDCGEQAKLSFAVKDTGIGIKKDDISRLFNEFDRIDEKRNRNIEGTGLGINITTALLGLMESRLEVESSYGKGSVFSFEIQQKIIERKSVISENTIQKETPKEEKLILFEAPTVKVLVVDDNLLNRKVISSLLRITKVQVDQAESGKKCLEMVKQTTYDMILLDHMMPEMDGIETLEELLANRLIDLSQTPVIALTANAIVGAREEYLRNGFTDYLSKPVLPQNLNKMMVDLLPKNKYTLLN